MAFYNEILAGLLDIIKAPFVDLSALWLILPLFILWIILEIYFDIHQNEELGWNTALGNSITMFWISIELMRHLFSHNFENFAFSKLIMVILVLCYSLFIGYISFTHKFESKVTFHLAAPTPVYYWSGIGALWVYGSLMPSIWLIIDIILLFGLLLLFVYLMRKYGPFKSSNI